MLNVFGMLRKYQQVNYLGFKLVLMIHVHQKQYLFLLLGYFIISNTNSFNFHLQITIIIIITIEPYHQHAIATISIIANIIMTISTWSISIWPSITQLKEERWRYCQRCRFMTYCDLSLSFWDIYKIFPNWIIAIYPNNGIIIKYPHWDNCYKWD